MVTSETRLTGGGSEPRRLSLLAGLLIGIATFAGSLIRDAERSAAAAAGPSGAASSASAKSNQPQYEQLPIDEDLKKRPPSQQQNEVRKILRDNNKFGNVSDKATVDDYFQKYALPRWSQIEYAASRSTRAELTVVAFRRELRQQLSLAKGDIHEYLNGLVLDFMGKLLSGNYHPFTQVNAALMIGELDGGDSKPYAKALPVLIRIVEDAKQGDAVRAEAMIGIIRHAEAGISEDAARQSLTAAMLKQLTTEISSGLTAPGQVWIRGQVIETLGWLGSAGENGEVFKAILNSLGGADVRALVGAELSRTTRCIAARALGRLNYNGVKGINAAEAATLLGQLSVQICNGGLRPARNKGDPALFRRAMTSRLNAILVALKGTDDTHKGVLSLAGAQQKEGLAELQTFLEDTMEILNSKKSEPGDVETAARKLRDSVTNWLQKHPT
jgi:hypothetical protein